MPGQPCSPGGNTVCPRGHFLREAFVDELARVTNIYSVGAKCDICSRHINRNEVVRHCDTCNYDLCRSCWDVYVRPCSQQCPMGHCLREVMLEQLGRETPAYRTGAICNGCRRQIAPVETVRHCDPCHYDLCASCWSRNMPVIPPQPMPGQPCSPGGNTVCPRGHYLREAFVDELSRATGMYSSGAKCDICSRHINRNEVVRHCDMCNYDLCRSCWDVYVRPCSQQCPKGHCLREVMVEQLGRETPAYRTGAICNGCRRQIAPLETIRHCDPCHYDLCASCWNRIPVQPLLGGPIPPCPQPMARGPMFSGPAVR